MLWGMVEHLSHAHHPGHRYGRRKLVALIEALRPLGLNATVQDVAVALAPLRHGRWGIRISGDMLDSILKDHHHQMLINTVIMAGCKASGYETTYRDLYPVYVRKCEEQGIRPFALKTFQNRALQREARWQRTMAAQQAKQMAKQTAKAQAVVSHGR